MLDSALELARKASRGEITRERFVEAATKQAPEFAALWKLVAYNPDLTSKIFANIMQFLMFLIAVYLATKPPAPPILTQEVIEAIRQSSESAKR